MTIRKQGASRSGGSGRSGKGAARTKRAVPEPGVPVCLTCGEKFDVEFVKGSPMFYDHGTKEIHRCPK